MQQGDWEKTEFMRRTNTLGRRSEILFFLPYHHWSECQSYQTSKHPPAIQNALVSPHIILRFLQFFIWMSFVSIILVNSLLGFKISHDFQLIMSNIQTGPHFRHTIIQVTFVEYFPIHGFVQQAKCREVVAFQKCSDQGSSRTSWCAAASSQ